MNDAAIERSEVEMLREEKRRIESALQYRLEFENLVTTVSSRLIHSSAEELEAEIQSAVDRLGEFTQVDRCFLFMLSDDETQAIYANEWCAPGLAPHKDVYQSVEIGAFPWSMRMYQRFQIVYVPDVDDLPAEAAGEQQLWRLAGTRSLIAVPLVIGKKLIGVLGLTSDQAKRIWHDEDIRLLETVAQLIANALDRGRKDAALHQSAVQFRELADELPVAIAIHDETRFLYVNRAAEHMTGYTQEELYAADFMSYLHPDDSEPTRFKFEELANGAMTDTMELRFVARNGEERCTQLQARRVEFEGRIAYLIAAVDVTERHRTEEALRSLEKQLLEVSAREQIRIGQDLHDRLGQHLTGLGFRSQLLAEELAEKSLEEAALASAIVEMVTEAINQTRSLARGLYPVHIEADGLMTSLQELAAQTHNVYSIQCRFVCEEPILIYDNATATHLYRIAQEAVNNAVKHGRPTMVDIALACDGDSITLEIRDNGIGFSENGSSGKGLGLSIMKYRARMIDGVLTATEQPDGGVLISCRFTLADGAAGLRAGR